MIKLKKYLNLFNGADRGHFTLPPSLVAARTAFDYLEANPMPPRPIEPSYLVDDLARQAVSAASEHTPLLDMTVDVPAATQLLDAQRAVDLWDWTNRAHRQALEFANAQLSEAIEDNRAEILTNHLAPAMAEIQTELTKISAKIPASMATDASLILASDQVRKLWSQMGGISDRYSAIRAAQEVTDPAKMAQLDQYGEWSMVDNLVEIWPMFSSRQQVGIIRNPPWPQENRAFLLWVVEHGGQFVVLTREQRDARWNEKYSAAVEEGRQNRHQLQAFRAIGRTA